MVPFFFSLPLYQIDFLVVFVCLFVFEIDCSLHWICYSIFSVLGFRPWGMDPRSSPHQGLNLHPCNGGTWITGLPGSPHPTDPHLPVYDYSALLWFPQPLPSCRPSCLTYIISVILTPCQHQHYLALIETQILRHHFRLMISVILQGQCSNHWWFWCTLKCEDHWWTLRVIYTFSTNMLSLSPIFFWMFILMIVCIFKVNPILSFGMLWLLVNFLANTSIWINI